MNIRLVIFTLIFFTLSQSSFASEAEDKLHVFKMMKEYAKLVACMSSFEDNPENGRPTTLKDVTTVEYDKNDRTFVFYILWSGDMGCQGGSGTFSSYVTEVAKYGGDWKPFTIQGDYAFGENIEINYRYIESIKKISKNKFEIISWDYADTKFGGVDGGSNFPANKFKYTIERNSFEPWRITNKALLEQNKESVN